jgi:hypothetical protein
MTYRRYLDSVAMGFIDDMFIRQNFLTGVRAVPLHPSVSQAPKKIPLIEVCSVSAE